MKRCIICGAPRRYVTRARPCCRKCERTAPICVSAPLLFIEPYRMSATTVARSVLREMDVQEGREP